jgi:HD-GYP domain-containing protein (c-di-GMP phosphodiesterase class II)
VLLSAVKTLAAAIEMRDPVYTGHSARVATYCAAIAQALGLARAESRRIQLGALLHNVGQIALPTAEEDAKAKHEDDDEEDRGDILTKRAAATEKLIKKMDGLDFLLPVIRHYNERMDGTGFPDGLPGEKIPLAARILAVADRLDVLTGRGEPPGKKLALKDALVKVRSEAPSRFDPRVVDALLIAHRHGYLLTPEDRVA